MAVGAGGVGDGEGAVDDGPEAVLGLCSQRLDRCRVPGAYADDAMAVGVLAQQVDPDLAAEEGAAGDHGAAAGQGVEGGVPDGRVAEVADSDVGAVAACGLADPVGEVRCGRVEYDVGALDEHPVPGAQPACVS